MDQGGYDQIIDIKENNSKSENIEIDTQIIKEDFVYIQSGETVAFKSINNSKFECPACKKQFERILKHITEGKCKITKSKFDHNEFRNQHDAFKEGFRLEMRRNRKRKSRAKLIQERGLSEIRAEENMSQKQRKIDPRERH